MKYIMLTRTHAGCPQERPIIFPDCLVHEHVAGAILKCLGREYTFDEKPVAAGFISSMDGSVDTSQKSKTLGIGPGKDDELTIRMHDYLHGL